MRLVNTDLLNLFRTTVVEVVAVIWRLSRLSDPMNVFCADEKGKLASTAEVMGGGSAILISLEMFNPVLEMV